MSEEDGSGSEPQREQTREQQSHRQATDASTGESRKETVVEQNISKQAQQSQGARGPPQETAGQPQQRQVQPQPAKRPVTDVLKAPHVQKYVKYCVAVFLAVGVGFALSFALLTALLPDTGGFATELGAFGILFGFFLTPLISGFLGSVIGMEMDDDRRATAITAAAGSFAGYVAFLFLMVVAFALVGDGGSSTGGGGGGIGDLLLPLLGWGVGVAVAGAGTTAATKSILEGTVTQQQRPAQQSQPQHQAE